MRRTILSTIALAAATATSAMAQTRGVHSPVVTRPNGTVVNTLPNQCAAQRGVLGAAIPSTCPVDQRDRQRRHRVDQARKHEWKKLENARKHDRQREAREEREWRRQNQDREDFDRGRDRDGDRDRDRDGAREGARRLNERHHH